VLFHPVTTEFQSAESQMEELLMAVKDIKMQAVVLWPNVDAGADGVSQAIRRFREMNPDTDMHFYKNFEPEIYIPILNHASCAVGNSSSFVRDASFLGTPIVLVGSRQDGRERSESVIRVDPKKNDIGSAIRRQLEHGKYPSSDLYGKPGTSRMIAEKISHLKPYLQKKLVTN
ncbi:MAG: UDP-N-acetylglucosamine 2-epimerase (hydrolyzing), partial [Proteobacteria bacterium]